MNFDVSAGDFMRLQVDLANPDGTPFALVGAAVSSDLREDPTSTNIVSSWLCTLSSSTITLYLSPLQTSALNGRLYFDIEIVPLSGDVFHVLLGSTLTLKLPVTR